VVLSSEVNNLNNSATFLRGDNHLFLKFNVVNKYSIFIINTACSVEKQHIPIL
jgi:hypothetical protein